jgi:hypothetical protein
LPGLVVPTALRRTSFEVRRSCFALAWFRLRVVSILEWLT